MDTVEGAAPGHQFEFTGRTGEYFRIWIVSMCLSILTLGVYSAWGKVRKRRYLYAHTRVVGSGFEFRARPLAILKGRVIAVVLFGGFAVSSHFIPMAQWAFIALLLALTPWIVVAANRFNAQNSAYRNIRFGFSGRMREAAIVFLGLGALSVVTVGIVYPYYRLRRARFVVGRHSFGATAFETALFGGDFYAAYILALLMVFGAIIPIFLLFFAIAFVTRGGTLPLAQSWSHQCCSCMPSISRPSATCVRGSARRRSCADRPLRFCSTLRVRDLFWLYGSNILAILATAGLATPWATLRMARYRAQKLKLFAHAPLETLASSPADRATATASEVSDLFDVDVSL